MDVFVNGQSRSLPPGTTVEALLKDLGIQKERVAVERNQLVVRRAEQADTVIEPGDVIEIVAFLGGG